VEDGALEDDTWINQLPESRQPFANLISGMTEWEMMAMTNVI